jgi:hypothetical protein
LLILDEAARLFRTLQSCYETGFVQNIGIDRRI